MPIARLDEIAGISLEVDQADRDDLIDVIHSALGVAADLSTKDFGASINLKDFSGRSLNLATMAAAQSVNSLLSAVSAKCTLVAPPEEIEMEMKGSRLIYRCYHNPAHEWDLLGNPIP